MICSCSHKETPGRRLPRSIEFAPPMLAMLVPDGVDARHPRRSSAIRAERWFLVLVAHPRMSGEGAWSLCGEDPTGWGYFFSTKDVHSLNARQRRR